MMLDIDYSDSVLALARSILIETSEAFQGCLVLMGRQLKQTLTRAGFKSINRRPSALAVPVLASGAAPKASRRAGNTVWTIKTLD